MHSFEVHSNESASRKNGCLGLDQVTIYFHRTANQLVVGHLTMELDLLT